jgi:hypothetical protein
LHYKRKATPNGKQKLPRAVLARQRAGFVALEFILRKRLFAMVNAGFRFASAHALFWLAHDLIRPSFARRSGLREGGKPVPTPDHVEDMLFGIMRGTATGR